MTPEADASCPALMSTLPLELVGRAVPAGAVGLAVRLRLGRPGRSCWSAASTARPATSSAARAIQINGVQWYVDTSDPDTTVWTTVDRPVYVQISLPAIVDSAPVTALTPQIAPGPALPGAHARARDALTGGSRSSWSAR